MYMRWIKECYSIPNREIGLSPPPLHPRPLPESVYWRGPNREIGITALDLVTLFFFEVYAYK